MKYAMKRYIYFLIIALLCVTTVTHAQSLGQINAIMPTSIDLQVIPENPGPNESVSAVIQSYDTDLNAATLSWSVNGKLIKSGKGIKDFTFTTGNMNTTTNLGLTIRTAGGQTVNKSYRIRPTSVDLLWQTSSYTPPFYKGKALFSYQNKIQFIALPHITGSNGKEISPSNLIYTWTRNDIVLGDYSGYGKNTFTMIGSIIARPIEMSVTVTSPDTNAVGSASTVVDPIDPVIFMYEKNPLYGIKFEKSLPKNFTLEGSQEIEVLAIPYYFGTLTATDPNLSYAWSVNNSSINDGTDLTSRIFRQKEGSQGKSYISLSMENSNKVLQSASFGFNLEFGKKTQVQQPEF